MSSSNVSSVVSFFSTANEGFTTTLANTVAPGATTVPLTSTSGMTNGTIFVGIVEPGLTNQQSFTGTVDTVGTQITSVVWTRGTNVSHAAGVIVVDYVSGTAHNMTTTGLQVAHQQSGVHKSGAVYPLATITDFTNSVHTHQSNAGGGVLTGAAMPNLSLSTQSLSNPYQFSAYKSSTTQTASTGDLITFDVEDYDTNSNFASSLYTAPVAGKYHFDAGVYVSSASTTTQLQLYANGVAVKTLTLIGSSSGDALLNGSTSMVLAQNDTIGVHVIFSGGGSRTIQNISTGNRLTWFNGNLISQT